MALHFEPEETIGQQWHRLVGGASSWPHHPHAAVRFDEVRGRLGVMFRALGGPGGVRLVAAGATISHHRLGLRARLGLGAAERLDVPRFDGVSLQLPPALDLLPERALNESLYEWLAAWFALAVDPVPPPADLPQAVPPPPDLLQAVPPPADLLQAVPPPADLLQTDVRQLREARAHTARVLEALPGLRPVHERLSLALRMVRPRRRLPAVEAAVEAAVLATLGEGWAAAERLGAAAMVDPAVPLERFRSGRHYRPFLPVPLWGAFVAPKPAREQRDAGEEEGGGGAPADARQRRASRRANDWTRRRDPLLLNRFETILGLAEMVNLKRAIEDDDEEGARQAAEDLDEITVGEHERKTATRLKLELDLPAEAIATEPLPAAADEIFVYPEWDYTRRVHHPAHCRVIAGPATDEGEDWTPDEAARRQIRRVCRQFEALRPRRQILHAQPDGEELDLSALVRSLADGRAGAAGSDRVYRTARTVRRDLAVAVLVDVSLSTESWVGDRRVLDIEKQALLALAGGLDACGDEHAIFTFTSRRRDAVWIRTVKDFDERLDTRAVRRIRALRPGHYTRMGAAVRHAARRLADRPMNHRLLLLLTDGKPNDADYYEGRYAVEDTRMAIGEARRAGIKVFGITVDQEARDYFPYIFGPGAYAIFPDVSRLPAALPAIYRQLTA